MFPFGKHRRKKMNADKNITEGKNNYQHSKFPLFL